MDDNGLNMRNWGGYYKASLKSHLGLQLMSSVVDRDTTKSFLTGREEPSPLMVASNGVFNSRNRMVSNPPDHLDFVRNNWINHPEKFNIYPGNPYNAILAETSANNSTMQMIQQPNLLNMNVNVEDKPSPVKKRKPNGTNTVQVQRAKVAKKSMEMVINGIEMDISGIPIPVCSCTGVPQQCYRWGCGGWQSACCTTSVNMYPLPMNPKRSGARIAGRKMSQGAFKKVLEKLALEGVDFSQPIDLKTHWAKHGTNKFVTIR